MRTKVIRTATIAVLLVVGLILPVQAGLPGQGPPHLHRRVPQMKL